MISINDMVLEICDTGLTQNEIAKAINVSQPGVHYMLKAKTCNNETFVKLLNLYTSRTKKIITFKRGGVILGGKKQNDQSLDTENK